MPLFHVQYKTHPEGGVHDATAWLNIGGAALRYVHEDIVEVGTYLTGPGFLDLLLRTETYAATVEKEKPAANKEAQRPPRVQFNIKLESPEICVPAERGSNLGLMLYPGHIIASNEFIAALREGEIDREVIHVDIDRLRVDAQQANSLHAMMGEGWDVDIKLDRPHGLLEGRSPREVIHVGFDVPQTVVLDIGLPDFFLLRRVIDNNTLPDGKFYAPANSVDPAALEEQEDGNRLRGTDNGVCDCGAEFGRLRICPQCQCNREDIMTAREERRPVNAQKTKDEQPQYK